MLEPVEVFVQRRQALRRQVDLVCSVVADLWDEPVEHQVRDLSHRGLYLDTPLPVDPGTELVLELCPPGCTEPLYLYGRVCRVDLRRRAHEVRGAGLGVELLETPSDVEERLRTALHGLPPRLPGGHPPTVRELVWVEMLLTWEEDLGDRVNVFEVSELLQVEDSVEDALGAAVPLAELQGVGSSDRWFASAGAQASASQSPS